MSALPVSRSPRAASQETCPRRRYHPILRVQRIVAAAPKRPARPSLTRLCIRPIPRIEASGFLMPARFLFLLLVAVLLAPSGSTQSTPDDSVRVLAPISVVAARAALPVTKAPARVTVLGPEDIAASGSTTAADLLEARSGMFVRRYGPDGLASFSLRGTGASHTLVLLDGHRIADPQLGQLDATLLPAALLGSVEVLHGAASGLYGTDAVGGVVAIRTPDGATPMARLTMQTGAFGERGVSALAASPVDAIRLPGVVLRATVAVDHYQSRNDYPYTDSTAFNAETGTSGVERLRENTDLRRNALYGRLGGEIGRHQVALGALLTDADRGLFDYSAIVDSRQQDAALRLWGDHSVRLGAVRLHTGGLWQRASLRYMNPQLGLDDEGRTRILSLQSRLERGWALAGGAWTATLGGRLGSGAAEHPSLAGDARETTAALFASLVIDYDRLVVTPALRLDRSSVRGQATDGADVDTTIQALAPQIGLNVQPTPWPALRFKASAGRAFRTPTFNDRFWQPGGDPALRPERGWTSEAGAMLDLRPGPVSLTAEGTLFTSQLRDQIVWRPTRFPTGTFWVPINVGRTRTVGWELSANARLNGALGGVPAFAELGGMWTHTEARDRTDPESTAFDQPLLYVPDDQAKVHLALGLHRLRLDAQVRHASRRASASDGSAFLAPYTLLDAGASYTLALPTWSARLGGRIENLTDAAYYVTPRNPMPPRALRFTLTIETR